jgi:hypothetical protein
MSVIKLDADMTSQFAASKYTTLVCAENGEPLGLFLPPEVYKKLVYQNIEVPFSDEEIQRLSQIPGGYSLQELWGRVQARVSAGDKA